MFCWSVEVFVIDCNLPYVCRWVDFFLKQAMFGQFDVVAFASLVCLCYEACLPFLGVGGFSKGHQFPFFKMGILLFMWYICHVAFGSQKFISTNCSGRSSCEIMFAGLVMQNEGCR